MALYIRKPTATKELDVFTEPIPVTHEMIMEIRAAIEENGLLPPGPMRSLQMHAVDEHIRILELQSRGKRVTPEGWKMVVNRVLDRFRLSFIRIWSPIMITGSEARIADVMQATLNTFHKAGAATNTGFSATYELLHVPAKRKVNHVYFHFNSPISALDVFRMKSKLVSRKIDNFLLDADIITYSERPDFWWRRVQMAAQGFVPRQDDMVLVLKFDPVDMITYKVSLHKISRKIYKNADRTINIFFSPLKDGIMEIIASRSEIDQTNTEVSIETQFRTFYDTYLIPDLDRITVSGISGVDGLFVEATDIRSSFLYVTPIDKEKALRDPQILGIVGQATDISVFDVALRRDVMMYKGVSLEEIKRMARAYGGDAFYDPSDIERIIIIMKGNVKPTDLCQGPIPGNPEDTTLDTHHSAILITTELEELLKLPYCDIDRTYSNNFHVMAKVFDIEVARNYHYRNSIDMLESLDASTNTHWIEAFSDVITQSGTFKGVGSSGISKLEFGFLTRSTISEPNKILPAAAIFDRKGESVRCSSTAIAVGQKPRLGTGTSKGTGVCEFGVDFGEDIDFESLNLDEIAISFKGEEVAKSYIETIYDTAASADDIDPEALTKQGQILGGGSVKLRVDEDRKAKAFTEKTEVMERSLIDSKAVAMLKPPVYGKGLSLQLQSLMNRYRRSATDIMFEGIEPLAPTDVLPKLNIEVGVAPLINLTNLRIHLVSVLK